MMSTFILASILIVTTFICTLEAKTFHNKTPFKSSDGKNNTQSNNVWDTKTSKQHSISSYGANLNKDLQSPFNEQEQVLTSTMEEDDDEEWDIDHADNQQLLLNMADGIESLRTQLVNMKYQNHLIYKQLKRMNNKCMANPVQSDSPRKQAVQTHTKDRCGKEFHYHAGTKRCYKFENTRLTWRMAHERCQNIDGDMVSIDSSAVQRYIAATARASKDLKHCDYWLGATDQDREGDWRWADSNRPVTYNNWNHNEPNNGNGDEHCAQMLWVFNWAWNDASCDYNTACYVCQQRPSY